MRYFRLSIFAVGCSCFLGTAVAIAGQAGTDYTNLHRQASGLVKAGRFGEALAPALEASELRPSEPATHELLSTIYSGLGDQGKAVTEARRVAQLRPGDELAHYNLALGLQAQHHYSEALAEFQRAVELGDKAPYARIGKAQCLLTLGKTLEAIRELEDLSRRFPQEKAVWLNLAHAYLAYQDTRGAYQAVTTAMTLDPDYVPAIKVKALLEYRGWHFNRAFDWTRRLIQLEPKNPAGYKFAAKIAAHTAWDGLPGAEWLLAQSLNNLPACADVFMSLGTAYRRPAELATDRRKPQSLDRRLHWQRLAIAAFQQAAHDAPNRADTNLSLAQMLIQARRFHEALPYARRALELSKTSAEAQETYRSASRANRDLAGQLRLWLQSLIY